MGNGAATSTNSATSAGNAEQQALAAIEAQYQEAESYIVAMKSDASRIKLDDFEIWYWSGFPTEFTPYMQDKASAQADMANQAAKLKALDPTFAALCDSLNSLLDCIDSAMEDSGPTATNIQQDIACIQPALNKILDAMKQKLQGDMYQAEMNSAYADNLTPGELAALAEEMIGSETSEQADLSDVSTDLTALIQSYQTAYNNANIDLNGYMPSVFDLLGMDDSAKDKDKAIMANAQDMMNGLTAVLNAISPEIASVMPAFTQVMNVIEEVKKQVEKILNDIKMTPGEKQGAILALVMFLLTFFQVVKQDVQTEKVKNNQDMSKGLIESSKINIDNTMANQKILEEQERNAKIMQTVMIITEVVMGALMAAMAPGVGTALLVGMVTTLEVLQTSGTWDGIGDLTGAIAGGDGKLGQIGADVIVGLMEMAVTMGGGAILDQAISKLMEASIETAVKTATKSAEELIQKATAEVIKQASKEGDKGAILAVQTVYKQVAEKAAEKAAEGAAAQFMKQPFATLVSMGVKGFKQGLETTMQRAAQEAIETAIEDSTVLTQLALKGVESTDDIAEGLATRAANEAVASVSGKSIEKVANEAAETGWGIARSRALWSAVFATGNTNMITDMLKEMGVTDDTAQEVLQVIQQLIQMLALMLGSGMMSGATIEGIAQGLPRAVNIMQLAPQAVQTAADYSMYETNMKQSKAVTAIAMEGSVSDLLHSFIEQLQKDANLEQSIATHDQTQDAQSTLSMAGHLHDGDNAMIQVLISAAG